MDSVRNITAVDVRRAPVMTVKDVAEQAGEAARSLFQLLFYIFEYAVSAAYRFFSSEKAAYVLGRYKRAVCGISALVFVFAFIGIVGGMEAGLISLAVGAPVCLLICGAVRLLCKD